MAQLQRMDACLDTLTNETSQVTTCVGRIARCQARVSGFIASLSPSPKAFEDKDVNDGSGEDDDDEDEVASSFDDKEITASQ